MKDRSIGGGHLQPVLPVIPDSEPSLPVETRPGSPLDIFIKHETLPLVDLLFINEEGTATLSAPGAIDDRSLAFEAGHGISVGDTLNITSGTRFTQVTVLTVVVNDIGIDSPLDFAYPITSTVRRGIANLKVDGSVTPVVFNVTPQDCSVGIGWNIIRILISIVCTTEPDDSLFANLPALTNGVVFRENSTAVKNIFNAKTNGQLSERMYDVEFTDKAGGGNFSVRGRRTFGGADKNGAVIHLVAENNDALEVIVQDDLDVATLVSFRVVAQGHVIVEN